MPPLDADERSRFYSSSGLSWPADLYLGYLACWIVLVDLHYYRMRSAWIYGSWLINYRGGFVRRGLSGEIFLDLKRLLHVPLLAEVLVFQLSCFALILLVVRQLLRSRSHPVWVWALVVSPATFAFPIFDSSVAFRQEILLFALLAVLVLIFRKHSSARTDIVQLSDGTLSLCLATACPAIILCHEGLVCYFPYVAVAMFLGFKGIKRTAKVLAIPTVLVCVALYQTMTHTGNAIVASRVCQALRDPAADAMNNGICSGSIYFLQQSRNIYRQQVISLVHDRDALLLYSIATILCFLPILLGLFDVGRRGCQPWKLSAFASATLLSMAASSILFINALDWGRWIYTHVLCVSLLLFWLHADLPLRRDAAGLQHHEGLNTWVMRSALFLYATCWNLPFFPAKHFMGYAGVASRFLGS